MYKRRKQRWDAIPGQEKAKSEPKPRQYPESDIQRALFDWARFKHVRVGGERFPLTGFMFHIPNERTSGLQRKILSGLGVLPGVSDVFVSIPRGPAHGLYLEIKAPGKKLTSNQVAFQDRMALACYATAEAKNTGQAIETVEVYLGELLK